MAHMIWVVTWGGRCALCIWLLECGLAPIILSYKVLDSETSEKAGADEPNFICSVI